MRQKLTLAIAFFAFALLALPATGQAVESDPVLGQESTTETTAPETGLEPALPEIVTEPPPAPEAGKPGKDPGAGAIPNDEIEGPAGPGDKASSKGRGSKKRGKGKTGGQNAEELKEDKPADDPLADDFFGPAPIAVPNMVLDSFEIPPFLLPIYQACGTQYAIPWQLLAAINKIETAFGTNLSVSYAGAMGWMQFMPGTWASYGVDANGDGRKDPYNPVDAICAAARYLRAAGGTERLREAIFAYNHANWYVDDVLELTRKYSRLPEHLIASITGLTEGAYFPVASNARYADQVTVAEAVRKARRRGGVGGGNVAELFGSAPDRRAVTIFARPGAPVVAVNDGVVRAIGESERLGRFIVLEDVYGNRYTYAGLGSVAEVHPVPRRRALTDADFEVVAPAGDEAQGAETQAAEMRRARRIAERVARRAAYQGEGAHRGGEAEGGAHVDEAGQEEAQPVNTEDARPRLFARPRRPNNVEQAALVGQLDHPIAGGEEFEAFEAKPGSILEFNGKHHELQPLKEGSRVIGGTLIGHTSMGDATESGTIRFYIRPAGVGAPAIDPKPILDGWRLLAATDIYRAKGRNPFFTGSGIGQVLMLPKSALIRRVLGDPRIEIYSCGRDDIASGSIDRRILTVLAYLVERGFRLTVTSLTCGHGYYTASGNPSNHSFGRAVDIAAINGQPIYGNQGPGSLTEAVLKAILRLQGTMTPSELISLHELGGPSFAMADHADHIHVGYRAIGDSLPAGDQAHREVLEPEQWARLMRRLGRIENPVVPDAPSPAASPAKAGE